MGEMAAWMPSSYLSGGRPWRYRRPPTRYYDRVIPGSADIDVFPNMYVDLGCHLTARWPFGAEDSSVARA